jgi:serine/threonine protein phosphatase PrpC
MRLPTQGAVMSEAGAEPRVSIGFATHAGQRKQNEDFVAAVVGGPGPDERRDTAAALADGIGGARGGRVAAETAVRGFLDGLGDVPETMEVRWAAARILGALNGWMHSQGRQDDKLKGMGCTFTAVVLRGRAAHVVHVGDSRAYRLSGDHLTRLTEDHVREGPGGGRLLYRALGVEGELRLDYAAHPMALHDRFLLCSDGVHGALADDEIDRVLSRRDGPGDAARALVDAALQAGSADNCTALVLDVVALPMARLEQVGEELMRLPAGDPPLGGETIDGFRLRTLVSDGAFSRLFAAEDELEGGHVVLKFPKPGPVSAAAQHAAFAREAWVGARVQSPWVCRVLELAPGRQSRLYVAMPLYQGDLLETRLASRPFIGLEEGRVIAVKLAHAAAALHRAHVIHRDIKPDNVLLEASGGLKLLDLGVVRLPGLEDGAAAEIPGTAAYMAPEMFAGEPGNEATDIYALGVTLFRAFTGEYPYGESDATSRQRLERPKDLLLLRPDLPAWLGEVLARAIAADPAARYGEVMELAQEMEAGPAGGPAAAPGPPTLYERYRLRFWQALAALLAIGLIVALWRR